MFSFLSSISSLFKQNAFSLSQFDLAMPCFWFFFFFYLISRLCFLVLSFPCQTFSNAQKLKVFRLFACYIVQFRRCTGLNISCLVGESGTVFQRACGPTALDVAALNSIHDECKTVPLSKWCLLYILSACNQVIIFSLIIIYNNLNPSVILSLNVRSFAF
jgi:hypothetical protein